MYMLWQSVIASRERRVFNGKAVTGALLANMVEGIVRTFRE